MDGWVQAREGGDSGLGVQPDSPRARGRSLPSAFSQDPLLPSASSPIPEGISKIITLSFKIRVFLGVKIKVDGEA